MANTRVLSVGFIGAVLTFGNCEFPECLDWTQWGQSSAHNGNTCSAGQAATNRLDDVVFDPFVPAEAADFGDGLAVHYQTPLISGEDLYMEVKSGNYFACDPPGSGVPAGCGFPGTWAFEIWNETHFKISDDGKLTKDWSFQSDWKPEPFYGFEPVFHAALGKGVIYVPGAGGTIYKLDSASGKQLAQLNPFGQGVDPNTYVAGPLTVDALGNVYYNAIKLDPASPYNDVQGAWLVKVDARDTIKTVTYAQLVPDAPKATDLCIAGYDPNVTPAPYPPLNPDGTVVPAPSYPCQSQRPSVNLAPAVGPDGVVYTASRAHGNEQYSYLVAVNPDLTPRWHTSLRGLVNDGCGVLVPEDGNVNPADCTPGAPKGVDPYTGVAPAMAADDSSTSSPLVLPDGSIAYGGLSYYNGDRGHMLKFDARGRFLTSFDFGWDVTPAVFPHDGTYSLLLKDNHYSTDANGVDNGQYYLTSLDANLKPEWKFQSTNTQSCTRNADGSVSCVTDHPYGFEWCINAPAVDRDGTMYANSEDGNLYVIGRDGKEKGHLFLNLAQGAAYTPLSLDRNGHIFVMNAGHLTVIGQPGAKSTLPAQE